VQVIPGTYRLVKLSSYARELFEFLRIDKGPGDDLTNAEVDAVLTFYVHLLEAVCTGHREYFQSSIGNRLELVRIQIPAETLDLAFMFSGGVGELVYRFLEGLPWPTTTHFGDLGIDLAQRMVQSPIWMDSLQRFRPKSAGRATVYGLLRHTTEVSGNSLFLGAAGILPLADLPVLGSVRGDSSETHVRDVLTLVRRSPRGGGIQVRLGSQEAAVVRTLGQRIARILQEDAFPAMHPLVFLVQENLGKVLGQYLTGWGALPLCVLVIDEVPLRDAHYVQIGSPRDQVVPVSYYGFQPHGDTS
jgi:ethanolamine utilization protein EutA